MELLQKHFTYFINYLEYKLQYTFHVKYDSSVKQDMKIEPRKGLLKPDQGVTEQTEDAPRLVSGAGRVLISAFFSL